MKYFSDLFSLVIGGFALGAYWAGLLIWRTYVVRLTIMQSESTNNDFRCTPGTRRHPKNQRTRPPERWLDYPEGSPVRIFRRRQGVGLAGERSDYGLSMHGSLARYNHNTQSWECRSFVFSRTWRRPWFACRNRVWCGMVWYTGLWHWSASPKRKALDCGVPQRQEIGKTRGLFKSDLSIGSGETRTSNKPEESENDVVTSQHANGKAGGQIPNSKDWQNR